MSFWHCLTKPWSICTWNSSRQCALCRLALQNWRSRRRTARTAVTPPQRIALRRRTAHNGRRAERNPEDSRGTREQHAPGIRSRIRSRSTGPSSALSVIKPSWEARKDASPSAVSRSRSRPSRRSRSSTGLSPSSVPAVCRRHGDHSLPMFRPASASEQTSVRWSLTSRKSTTSPTSGLRNTSRISARSP